VARGDFKQRVIFELVDDASGSARRIEGSFRDVRDELNSLDGAAKRSQSRLGSFTSFLRNRFVFTFQDVAGAIRQVWQSIQETITLEGQETALRNQLSGINQSFDEFIEQLDKAASGTVATADLISASSRALLLGIPADEIANLLEIAGSRAAATGQTVAKAFDDITTGIGRASPLILDNLGFVISLEETYAQFGETLGKTAGELTKAEQSQALLNVVLQQGAQDLESLGTAADATFVKLQQGQAAFSNFKTTVSELTTALGVGLAGVIVNAGRILVGYGQVVTGVVAAITDLLSALPGVGSAFEFLNEKVQGANDALDEQAAKLIETRDALLGLAKVTAESALGFDEQAQAIGRGAANSQSYVDQMRGVKEITEETTPPVEELVVQFDEQGRAVGELLPQLASLQGAYSGVSRAAATAGTSVATASSGLTARSSGSQGLVDAAFAAGNRPILGGTRIKVAGGSRLLK
jgi:hypothetical protein